VLLKLIEWRIYFATSGAAGASQNVHITVENNVIVSNLFTTRRHIGYVIQPN